MADSSVRGGRRRARGKGKKRAEDDEEEEEEEEMEGSSDEEDAKTESIMMKYFRQGELRQEPTPTSSGMEMALDESEEVIVKLGVEDAPTPTTARQKEEDREIRKRAVNANRKERARSIAEEPSVEELALAAAAEAAAEAAKSGLTDNADRDAKLHAALQRIREATVTDEKYAESLKAMLGFAKKYPRIRLAHPNMTPEYIEALVAIGFIEDKGFLIKQLDQKSLIMSNIEKVELVLTEIEMKGAKMYIDFSKIATMPHNCNVHIANSRYKIGHAETIGRRPAMEDEIMVIGRFRGKDELIGVFDGHGGRNAAVVAAQVMPVILQELLDNEYPDDPKTSLREAFLRTHQQICRARLQSGTTALVTLVTGNRLYVAHAGDSRGVLCRSGRAIRLTEDHKPNNPEEKRRITKLGGKVVSGWGWFTKVYRVNGILSVARALGDEELQPYVTAEPTISDQELNSHDQFLILACDGVWDKVSDRKAVQIVSKYKDPVKASESLRDYAFKRGSTDNITVVVIRL